MKEIKKAVVTRKDYEGRTACEKLGTNVRSMCHERDLSPCGKKHR